MSQKLSEFTQDKIDSLIKCPKIITKPPKKNMILHEGHYRNHMELESKDGQHKFFVFMRKNEMFEENFSIGLEYLSPDGTRLCLVRFNGPHGEHINDFDFDNPHLNYHIHIAKEENIIKGLKPEKYAEVTRKFATFDEALLYFLDFCNITDKDKYFNIQLSLFSEE